MPLQIMIVLENNVSTTKIYGEDISKAHEEVLKNNYYRLDGDRSLTQGGIEEARHIAELLMRAGYSISRSKNHGNFLRSGIINFLPE